MGSKGHCLSVNLSIMLSPLKPLGSLSKFATWPPHVVSVCESNIFRQSVRHTIRNISIEHGDFAMACHWLCYLVSFKNSLLWEERQILSVRVISSEKYSPTFIILSNPGMTNYVTLHSSPLEQLAKETSFSMNIHNSRVYLNSQSECQQHSTTLLCRRFIFLLLLLKITQENPINIFVNN